MIRLLIVDDHPIIVSGVEALLLETDFRIVRHVRRGDEALQAIAEDSPDIVLLDERLPGKNGLDIFRELRARGDRRPVVLLTGTMAEARAMEAVAEGIDGFVLKHSAPDHLIACLGSVRRGERWIERSILQLAFDRTTKRDMDHGPFAGLTPREQDIVRLAGQNVRNAEIAARLGIQEGTVKVHLHNIYEKLGLSNRVDLVMLIRDGHRG